jgi:hypothetical protein
MNRFVRAACIFAILVIVGSFVFYSLEEWNYLDALFYTANIATAVGSPGDVVPTQEASKVFFIPFSVATVCTFLVMCVSAGEMLYS